MLGIKQILLQKEPYCSFMIQEVSSYKIKDRYAAVGVTPGKSDMWFFLTSMSDLPTSAAYSIFV
jgi:hypothetical protein